MHRGIQIANFLIFSYTKHILFTQIFLNISTRTRKYVLYCVQGVTSVSGITKVIDELGLMIIAKNVELELKQREINELKDKIELIESYLEIYDEFYNK